MGLEHIISAKVLRNLHNHSRSHWPYSGPSWSLIEADREDPKDPVPPQGQTGHGRHAEISAQPSAVFPDGSCDRGRPRHHMFSG